MFKMIKTERKGKAENKSKYLERNPVKLIEI